MVKQCSVHLIIVTTLLLGLSQNGYGEVRSTRSGIFSRTTGADAARLAKRRIGRNIRKNIPLCRTMKFRFLELDSRHAVTDAPLGPSINPHGTAFAGAQYSLAIATGWALVTHHLERTGMNAHLVQREGTIQYKAPINGRFQCTARLPKKTEINGFKKHYDKTGTGRLNVVIEVKDKASGTLASTLAAQFTAIDRNRR